MTEHPAYEQARQVTPFASVVLAANPSPMTLDGTNTWLLRAPGAADAIVVDPGPDDATHLEAVRDAPGTVAAILLTHGHPDHSAGRAPPARHDRCAGAGAGSCTPAR